LPIIKILLSTPFCKNISLHPEGQIKGITPPVSPKRGADRDRHERCGGMRWTLMSRRRTWLTWTAKSCGPDAAVLASSSRKQASADDGGKKAVHRGEHEVSRKPLRREGRMLSAEPVCSCAHSYAHIARETAGAARTRLSLRPLLLRRDQVHAQLGRIAPRERAHLFGYGIEWESRLPS
jgi:hypothetical protein